MVFHSRQGLSTVVATVILVLIVMSVAVGIFGFVLNYVNDAQEDSLSCFDVGQKIRLVSDYTCNFKLEKEGVINNYYAFSIAIDDIEVDKMRVTAEGAGGSKTYFLEDGRDQCDTEGNCGTIVGNYRRCWDESASPPWWAIIYKSNPTELNHDWFYTTRMKSNEANTYVTTGDFTLPDGKSFPDRISIAPVINGKQCETVDEIVMVECSKTSGFPYVYGPNGDSNIPNEEKVPKCDPDNKYTW